MNFSGSSALIRHSKLCPVSLMSGCLNESVIPEAIRICSLTEIDAGHHFRDGVLDLNARVHFHKKEVAVFIEQELHGADVAVKRMALTASTATRPISRRNRSSIAGEGVSSTSFWWRR